MTDWQWTLYHVKLTRGGEHIFYASTCWLGGKPHTPDEIRGKIDYHLEELTGFPRRFIREQRLAETAVIEQLTSAQIEEVLRCRFFAGIAWQGEPGQRLELMKGHAPHMLRECSECGAATPRLWVIRRDISSYSGPKTDRRVCPDCLPERFGNGAYDEYYPLCVVSGDVTREEWLAAPPRRYPVEHARTPGERLVNGCVGVSVDLANLDYFHEPDGSGKRYASCSTEDWWTTVSAMELELLGRPVEFSEAKGAA